MTSEMDPEATPQFCITSRFGLISWACCKIIFDVIVLICMVEPMMDVTGFLTFLEYVGWIVVVLMMAVLIVDIVFHGKLIHGLRKDTVKHLTAYCKYTKVLWMYILIFIAIYVFLQVTGCLWYMFRYTDMENAVIIIISSMAVGILFQSVMMLLVIKEIKKIKGENYEPLSGRIKIFNIGFSITIETSCTENMKESANNKIDADVNNGWRKSNYV